MNGRNGMSDIDDLIGRSLRERASHAPGRAQGMTGVRRRVRRRQQRHAVLAVAPMALMSAYFVARERSTGALPASGGSAQLDPLGTVDDTLANSVALADSVAPTTVCAPTGLPTSTLLASTTTSVWPAGEAPWDAPTTSIASTTTSVWSAGEAPSDAPTTSIGSAGPGCVVEPAPSSPPEVTVTTIECIGAPDPCAPPSSWGNVAATTTIAPPPTTAPSP